MKTYRGHNEAVQVLVTVTGQTLAQRTPETISDIGDHDVMTDRVHYSGAFLRCHDHTMFSHEGNRKR